MNGAALRLHRGGIYLKHADWLRYFAGIEAVVLIRRDDALVMLPVRHAAAGGYLLKIRNGQGDRVVQAPDFFLQNGIPDDDDLTLVATWDSEQAGLVSFGLFVK